MKFLRISYPDIAMHTCSVMLHVFGFCALLGYIAGMPVWTWPLSLLALATCFYCGYYFELGYRQRRWTEFRYGGEKIPKRIFDFVKWRERRDAHKENRNCIWCNKVFNPLTPESQFCSAECCDEYDTDKALQTLGDA